MAPIVENVEVEPSAVNLGVDAPLVEKLLGKENGECGNPGFGFRKVLALSRGSLRSSDFDSRFDFLSD